MELGRETIAGIAKRDFDIISSVAEMCYGKGDRRIGELEYSEEGKVQKFVLDGKRINIIRGRQTIVVDEVAFTLAERGFISNRELEESERGKREEVIADIANFLRVNNAAIEEAFATPFWPDGSINNRDQGIEGDDVAASGTSYIKPGVDESGEEPDIVGGVELGGVRHLPSFASPLPLEARRGRRSEDRFFEDERELFRNASSLGVRLGRRVGETLRAMFLPGLRRAKGDLRQEGVITSRFLPSESELREISRRDRSSRRRDASSFDSQSVDSSNHGRDSNNLPPRREWTAPTPVTIEINSGDASESSSFPRKEDFETIISFARRCLGFSSDIVREFLSNGDNLSYSVSRAFAPSRIFSNSIGRMEINFGSTPVMNKIIVDDRSYFLEDGRVGRVVSSEPIEGVETIYRRDQEIFSTIANAIREVEPRINSRLGATVAAGGPGPRPESPSIRSTNRDFRPRG